MGTVTVRCRSEKPKFWVFEKEGKSELHPLWMQFDVDAEPMAEGGAGEIYRVKPDILFKISRPNRDSTWPVEMEAQMYEHMEKYPDLPIPKFYGHFQQGDRSLLVLSDEGIAFKTFEDMTGEQK